MTQLDLETLVTACASVGSDRKVTCETLADGDDDDTKKTDEQAVLELPPDFPPGSFWLSKDAEMDWFDRNAFLERKESTKGNSNANPSSNSNSQRFSVNLKSKASIIGLPKSQKATFADSTRRFCNKPASVRLFPKRTGSGGKSTVQMTDPGSPKVSCMGRVRSKRSRRRSNSIKRSEKPAIEKQKKKKEKAGFCSKVLSMFRSKKAHKKTSSRSGSTRRSVVEFVVEEPTQRRSTSVRVREIPVSDEPAAEPPGLGGMKRFVSGRPSESWTSEDFSQELGWRVGAS